jgi:hypothetical protein
MQLRTFQDLLDLTKASDVLQWLSPETTSSSTNATEPISLQCYTVTRASSSVSKSSSVSSKDASSTSYSKESTDYRGSSSRSPTRVRWADEQKIASAYSKGSSSPTRVQRADKKEIVSVRSFHEHEAWKHIQLARTAADHVENREVYMF